MWKAFFYFTRSQKAGIVALGVLLSVVGVAGIVLPRLTGARPDEKAAVDTLFVQEVEQFRRTLLSKDSIEQAGRKQLHEEKWTRRRERHIAPLTVELVTFDPNTADSSLFRQLGLPAWMASNVLKYRQRGGKFKQADDFRKIYGMTEEKFEELRPYIHIAPDTTNAVPLTHETTDTLFLTIELNAADTAELMQLSGIGTYYAKEIVRYRKQLGGFANVEQLREIKHMQPENFDKITPHCTVDTTLIEKIKVNRASIDFLRKHPYINFYQAKVIYEFRRAKGRLDGMDDLRRFDEFSESDLHRLRPYLSFD